MPDRSQPIRVDQIVRSNRKSIALIVERDGRLVVRAPRHIPDRQINDVVQQKADWIRAKQQAALQKLAQTAGKDYTPGQTFLYLGKPYPLEIVARTRPALEFTGDRFLLAQADASQARPLFETLYRRLARQVLSERAALYASAAGLQYSQVKITGARTRWGSCSSRGTLNFAWRLVMAPLPIVDYVVIHELCHLKVPNHSARYWETVAKLLLDYKSRRDWLRKNGHLLDLP